MKLLIIFTALFIVGCADSQKFSPTFDATVKEYKATNVMEVIRQAAESAPEGVFGVYILNIKATGEDERGIIYLNTELDYRDPRNVTVALHPKTLATFKSKYGTNLKDFFLGKKILVRGKAIRATIVFSPEGKPPYKSYYYQTHIRVSSANQIEVVK